MNQYPTSTITRSFSRKVFIKKYEAVDFFMSASHSFFTETTEEQRAAKAAELQAFCEFEVTKSIAEFTQKQNDTLPVEQEKSDVNF